MPSCLNHKRNSTAQVTNYFHKLTIAYLNQLILSTLIATAPIVCFVVYNKLRACYGLPLKA